MAASRTTIAGGAAGGLLLVMGLAVLAGAGDPFPTGIGGQLRAGTVPAGYALLISQAATACAAAPAPLLAAQLEAESSFNPAAVSSAGARGIAQFMPDTWTEWGRDENADGRADPHDPADAIPAQARYDCALAEQLAPALAAGRLTGDLTDLMLAAYNAGPGAVLAAGGIPQNAETPAYVTRIRTRAAAFTVIDLPAGHDTGNRIAATALQWVGRAPYVWGGGGPDGPTAGASPGIGFDCSGLVIHAIYQATGGATLLPHRADTQIRLARPVPVAQLSPGDLIAFADPGATTYHHIGIYLGQAQMVHAPDFGQTVEVTSLRGPYWSSQTWRAGRLP